MTPGRDPEVITEISLRSTASPPHKYSAHQPSGEAAPPQNPKATASLASQTHPRSMTTLKAAALPAPSPKAEYITSPPTRPHAHTLAAQHRGTSQTGQNQEPQLCFHLRRPVPAVIATKTSKNYTLLSTTTPLFQMLLSALSSLSLFSPSPSSPSTISSKTPQPRRLHPPTLHERLTRLLYLLHPCPTAPPVDLGSYDYLWRIKEQWLGSPFARCYEGPEFEALGRAERRRRVGLYEKRRADEFWYLVRAYGREVRWVVRRGLGLWPY